MYILHELSSRFKCVCQPLYCVNGLMLKKNETVSATETNGLFTVYGSPARVT